METPKTLIQAIKNGHNRFLGYDREAIEMQRHVRDYIAQKFGAAMLAAESESVEKMLQNLFSKIVNERE